MYLVRNIEGDDGYAMVIRRFLDSNEATPLESGRPCIGNKPQDPGIPYALRELNSFE